MSEEILETIEVAGMRADVGDGKGDIPGYVLYLADSHEALRARVSSLEAELKEAREHLKRTTEWASQAVCPDNDGRGCRKCQIVDAADAFLAISALATKKEDR